MYTGSFELDYIQVCTFITRYNHSCDVGKISLNLSRQFLKRHNDLSRAYEYEHETAKFVLRHCEPWVGLKITFLQPFHSNLACSRELLLIIIYAISMQLLVR